MILQRLKIENYKRLHDVEIVFPSIGIIGVAGQNGAGKSTLFEAILWALFPPRSIGVDQRDVTPRRGDGSETKVELTVETADATYTVVRSLRFTKGGAARPDARLYKGEETEPLVSGTDAVSEFVRTTILRMSPVSFTTTFFTKQKELAFFGAMGDTERRKEMQRLLDLDAIEHAQAELRTSRKQRRDLLDAKEGLYAERVGVRDFDADMGDARARESAATIQLAALEQALAELQAQHETAADTRDTLRAIQADYARLDGERRAAELRRDAAHAAVASAEGRLAVLAEREQRAAEIAPEIALLSDYERQLRDADATRAHAERVREQAQTAGAATQTHRRLIADADALVHDLDPLRDLLFGWEEIADAAPGEARARVLAGLLTGAAPLALERAKDRETVLAIQKLAEQAAQLAADATARENGTAQIEARLALASAGGDPAPLVEELEKRERYLGTEIAAQDAALKALRVERKTFTTLYEQWKSADHDTPCPTCGRPFSEDDAPGMLETIKAAVLGCDARGREMAAAIEAIRTESRQVSGELNEARERFKTTQQLVAHRNASAQEATRMHARAAEIQTALDQALAAAGYRRPPKPEVLREIEHELDLLQRAANTATQANRLAQSLIATAHAVAEAQTTLAALGTATYDEAAHRSLRATYTQVVALRGEAEAISRELAARPAELERRDRATGDAATYDAAIGTLAAERDALAFNPEALVQIAAEVSAIEAQYNEANAALTEARIALVRAENIVAAIEREQHELALLRAEAETARAEVNRYDRMDKGFTDFSQDLASRIQPRLSEYASDLVERMTNGRYVRFSFDENYAPALYDDDLQKFPLEKFSGGERDVAALAARIALSQLLAARGGHTIGFMVLDEVFGSLDGERRTLVLDALATMRDLIPQLFIISHVDDVRNSPVMDEVWTVATNPNGTSDVLRRGASDLLLTA